MPKFKATYVPRGVDIRHEAPDPQGSTYRTFSAPSNRKALQKSRVIEPDNVRLRKIERVDGGRDSTIYEIEVREPKRADGEDSMFCILKYPTSLAS